MKTILQFLAGTVVGFFLIWTINFISPVETQYSYFKPQFTFTEGWQIKINHQVDSEAELYQDSCNRSWISCYYIMKPEQLNSLEGDVVIDYDRQ